MEEGWDNAALVAKGKALCQIVRAHVFRDKMIWDEVGGRKGRREGGREGGRKKGERK